MSPRRRNDRSHAFRTAAGRAARGLLIEAVESRVLLSAAGDPDATFAADGTTTVGFGGTDRLYAVETLPGGKILAAGTSNGRLALAQFRADGTLDKSFDFDGKVISTVPIVPDDVQRLADGKILVSGSGAVARFNADGSLDTTYGGGDGEVRLTFPRPNGDSSNLLTTALQPDGKIVAVGYVSTFLDNGSEFDQVDDDPLVARYRPDGSLDPTFGGGTGYTRLSSEVSNTELLLVTVAPTGDIVAAGIEHGDPRENHVRQVFLRYAPDGTVKSSAVTEAPTPSRVDLRTIATAPDGTAVVAEGEDNDPVSNYTVYPPTIPPGTTPHYIWPNDIVAAAGLQPDDKVVYAGPIVGGFRVDRPDQSDGFGGGDGSVDVTFGGTAPGSPKVVTTDDSGRIIVAGTIGGDFAVARLLGDSASPPPTGGATTYEAEKAALSGAAVANNNAGYTGTGFVDYVNATNDFAEFTVNAPSAGSYTLTFRYANGGAAARALGLKVNGASRGSVSFAPTGSWTTWKTVTVTADLTAGANKVRLTATGQSGPNLDNLAVASSQVQPPPPPPPPPPSDGVYQAESATLVGAVKASNAAGYTGSGFADYVNPNNDYVEFVVNAPAAGRYSLGFRYANGSTAARTLRLAVDNTSPLDLSFAPTGGWDRWTTTTYFSSYLNAGRNVVRLTAIGQSGPNLDSLTVQPAFDLTYQAEDGPRQGGAVVSNAFGGYEGTGYVGLPNEGDSVEFVVNVPGDGRFMLAPRWANDGGTQSIFVTIDGAGVTSLPLNPTGSWTTWQTENLGGRFPLAAGTHRIRLIADSPGGALLDALTLNNAPSSFHEAEDATRGGSDPVVSNAVAGYSGRGFLDFINPAGAYASWELQDVYDLDDGREYLVQFRYANGGPTARAMRLSVSNFFDGEQVLVDRLSFAPTGSWSNWQTVSARVFLSAAGYQNPQILKLTSIGDSGPNLDWIAVL